MNLLERTILTMKIDEIKAMNWLQSKGIISDNAIKAADVADCDCQKACQALVLRKTAK